ncbi:hypothetical protein JCM10207_000199 [Rhodosporidiobolus poonsookiae]
MSTPVQPPPHPHLYQPLLYCSGFPSSTTDEDLVDALKDCLRLRLSITRDDNNPPAPARGKIEFETLDKAELALATCNLQRLSSGGVLSLSPLPSGDDPSPSPPSSDSSRLLKQLPFTTTPAQLFALLRPFGPLRSLTLLLAPPPAHAPQGSKPSFRGQAVATFFDPAHAQAAQEGLHFSEVDGQSIAVGAWDEKRAERNRARRSDVSVSTPSRSPAQSKYASPASAAASPDLAGRTSRWAADQASPPPPSSAPSTPAQQRYPASLGAGAAEFGPSPSAASRPMDRRSASAASQWSVGSGGGSPAGEAAGKDGLVDPCNLFVKSLPPALLSSHLHALFTPYGSIVSARVMTDPSTGNSREFGFVSFATPSSAQSALRGVDGQWVAVGEDGEVRLQGQGERLEGARRVAVRVHERKEVRMARLSSGGAGSEADDSHVERGMSALGLSTPTRPPATAPRGAVVPAPSSPALSVSPGASPSQSPSASRWASPAAASKHAPAPAPESPSPAQPVPQMSEHERLVEAVRGEGIEGGKVDEVVALLESLPKKDRALCLFNPTVLAQKVHDALAILSSPSSDPTSTSAPTAAVAAAPAPSLSLASLAPLSAAAILSALRSAAAVPSSLPAELRPAPTPAKEKDTDAFMDALEGKAVNEVKQKLGERVFKALKGAGIKGAPRLTIHLLDTEPDLRALAHVVDDWSNALVAAKAEWVKGELAAAAAK